MVQVLSVVGGVVVLYFLVKGIYSEFTKVQDSKSEDSQKESK